MNDELHPNSWGEQKMADVWRLGLTKLLERAPPPPIPRVVLVDPSFEALGLGDGVLAEAPAELAWRFGVTGLAARGVYNPGAGTYAGAAGAGTPSGADGDEVAYLHLLASGERAILYQTLETTLAPSTAYQLTVAVGNRLATNPYGPSSWGGYQIELLAGNEVIAARADEIVPPQGAFADVSLAVDSAALPAELLDRPLTLRMTLTSSAAGAATDFDFVRLLAD
jgi:hypothetical protein